MINDILFFVFIQSGGGALGNLCKTFVHAFYHTLWNVYMSTGHEHENNMTELHYWMHKILSLFLSFVTASTIKLNNPFHAYVTTFRVLAFFWLFFGFFFCYVRLFR